MQQSGPLYFLACACWSGCVSNVGSQIPKAVREGCRQAIFQICEGGKPLVGVSVLETRMPATAA